MTATKYKEIKTQKNTGNDICSKTSAVASARTKPAGFQHIETVRVTAPLKPERTGNDPEGKISFSPLILVDISWNNEFKIRTKTSAQICMKNVC